MEPDDWFTDLIHLNDREDDISGNLKNSDKQLSMHTIKNICDEYNQLKL